VADGGVEILRCGVHRVGTRSQFEMDWGRKVKKEEILALLKLYIVVLYAGHSWNWPIMRIVLFYDFPMYLSRTTQGDEWF
jgi:hypothetical protein